MEITVTHKIFLLWKFKVTQGPWIWWHLVERRGQIVNITSVSMNVPLHEDKKCGVLVPLKRAHNISTWSGHVLFFYSRPEWTNGSRGNAFKIKCVSGWRGRSIPIATTNFWYFFSYRRCVGPIQFWYKNLNCCNNCHVINILTFNIIYIYIVHFNLQQCK